MKYIVDKSQKDYFKIESTKENQEIIIKENVSIDMVNYVDSSCDIDIILEDNSNCSYVLFDKSDQSSINLNIDLNQNSHMSLLLTSFADNCDKKIKINLNQEGSEIDLKGIIMGNNSKSNINLNVYHNFRNTSSKIENYITARNSKINVNVEGKINKGNKGSNCSQRARGIVMDNNSAIKVLPTLLIDEYDVAANHGASIGKIDEEGLYYLMSRGINKKDAERLIVNGFIGPILSEIKNESIKDELYNSFKTKI